MKMRIWRNLTIIEFIASMCIIGCSQDQHTIELYALFAASLANFIIFCAVYAIIEMRDLANEELIILNKTDQNEEI